jgi:hypothetical protein
LLNGFLKVLGVFFDLDQAIFSKRWFVEDSSAWALPGAAEMIRPMPALLMSQSVSRAWGTAGVPRGVLRAGARSCCAMGFFL